MSVFISSNGLIRWALVVTIAAMLSACSEDNSSTPVTTNPAISRDNVFALPIRQVKAGVDVPAFEAQRANYIQAIEAEDGVVADREMQPFFDFRFTGEDLSRIFIGFTAYESFAALQAINDAVAGPTTDDYFATFDLITFQILQPLDAEELIDLSTFAPLGSGQVWEVAVRDLSQYDNFDQADYAQRRDQYLAILAQQEGFVREIQWISVSDPDFAVGMTAYESAEALQRINADAEFINAYTATGFLDSYPPNVFGMTSNVLK